MEVEVPPGEHLPEVSVQLALSLLPPAVSEGGDQRVPARVAGCQQQIDGEAAGPGNAVPVQCSARGRGLTLLLDIRGAPRP